MKLIFLILRLFRIFVDILNFKNNNGVEERLDNIRFYDLIPGSYCNAIGILCSSFYIIYIPIFENAKLFQKLVTFQKLRDYFRLPQRKQLVTKFTRSFYSFFPYIHLQMSKILNFLLRSIQTIY